jgi:VanZ family protein
MMMVRIKQLGHLKKIFGLLLLTFSFFVDAQSPDSLQTSSAKRRNILLIGGVTAYSGAMIGLNEVWYKSSPRESFHFFNDASEWKQVDKAGHLFSAFQLSSITSHALKWAGLKNRKSMIVASLTSLAVVSSIEIFDGFSSSYGASLSDLAANSAGATLFLGQQLLWNEIRIHPKYSFHQTSFAPQRPNVLGNGLSEEFIKDYNGQTYWLSIDMDKFMKFPKWLNVAVGYGSEEMIYANASSNRSIGLIPYRQYYLSLDLDVRVIKSKSKWVNALIYFANMVKIPAPALEFSTRGIKLHGFYF